MDLSFLEFAVYGFVAYSSFLMLIISVIKEMPMTKVLTIARTIYLIPGILCAGILAATGQKIFMPETITNSTTTVINGTTGVFLTNSTTVIKETSDFFLLNPVWIYFHIAISLILTFYVISQMLILMGIGPKPTP